MKRPFVLAGGIITMLLLIGAGCSANTTTTNTNTAGTNLNTAVTENGNVNTAPTTTTNTPVTTSAAVTIRNFAFAPTDLVVKAGTTVTWTNMDTMAHTVTGDNGGPASSTVGPQGTYSYTFSTAGTFTYHCSIHPSMAGSVTVTP